MGSLPWVLNDRHGRPIAAFRTRAMRRLVARYMRVVALGVLPGAGKGPGGAVETMVCGSRWHVNSCGQLVAGKEPTGMYAGIPMPEFKASRGRGPVFLSRGTEVIHSRSNSLAPGD